VKQEPTTTKVKTEQEKDGEDSAKNEPKDKGELLVWWRREGVALFSQLYEFVFVSWMFSW